MHFISAWNSKCSSGLILQSVYSPWRVPAGNSESYHQASDQTRQVSDTTRRQQAAIQSASHPSTPRLLTTIAHTNRQRPVAHAGYIWLAVCDEASSVCTPTGRDPSTELHGHFGALSSLMSLQSLHTHTLPPTWMYGFLAPMLLVV